MSAAPTTYPVIGGSYTGDNYRSVLFLNPGNTNHWLKLKLQGVRAGIGGRIKVTVATPGGPRQIFKTVNSGGSFGCSPLRQEIGLGDATRINQVEIYWPASGLRQVLTGLEPDHCYRVREGDQRAELWQLKRFEFDLKANPHPHTSAHSGN